MTAPTFEPGLDPSTIHPGLELPTFARTMGLDHWNRYAAVNDEFVPIHMDDEAGRAAGYSGAFGMGNLQYSFLHLLLHQWMGVERGRIVAVSCQFRSPTLKGITSTAKGVVRAVRTEGHEVLVDLDVWTEDSDGTKLAPGTATVALPA